jgi:hypothetical protein
MVMQPKPLVHIVLKPIPISGINLTSFLVMYIHNNTEVYIIDLISRQKVATRIIVGLGGGKINGKVVPIEHVVVKVKEVLMPTTMEPFCKVAELR